MYFKECIINRSAPFSSSNEQELIYHARPTPRRDFDEVKYF